MAARHVVRRVLARTAWLLGFQASFRDRLVFGAYALGTFVVIVLVIAAGQLVEWLLGLAVVTGI